MKSKILIADDHSMIRDGVKAMISRMKECTVVGEAVNGMEAVEKFTALKPDLVLMDISMPDLNGMEATKQILEENAKAKIIILSMYDDEDYISRCMELGVMGYVIKSETGSELEFAIRTVLKGQTYFSNQVQKVIFSKYTHSVVRRKEKEPEVKLTSRELEIVKLISDGLTSHQMAEKLFISPRTVETHRSNLIKKMGVKNSIELVKKIEKLGLI